MGSRHAKPPDSAKFAGIGIQDTSNKRLFLLRLMKKWMNRIGQRAFSWTAIRPSGGVFEMPQGKGGGSSKRGFAAMSKEKQREIASKGGKASHGGGRSRNSGGGGGSR
jgi:general stress protein YciG